MCLFLSFSNNFHHIVIFFSKVYYFVVKVVNTVFSLMPAMRQCYILLSLHSDTKNLYKFTQPTILVRSPWND